MNSDRPLDELLEDGIRLMWVGAHPDDESFVGALLAKAALRCGCPLHLFSFTRGEGGEDASGRVEGDLGAVRAQEFAEVAHLYRASHEMHGFFNAPLPMKSFPKRHELAARWQEEGAPADKLAACLRSFKPDVVITFAPVNGTTGHPEHELAARFTLAAVRAAAEEDAVSGGPHRVGRTYFALNRYKPLRLVGMQLDPFEPTETFDARQPCTGVRTCGEVMAHHTLPHRTQHKDMGGMRMIARRIHNLYLRRVDPWTESWDPFETAPTT